MKRILLAVTAALAVTEFAGSAQAAPVTVCNMVKASGYAKVVARRRAAGFLSPAALSLLMNQCCTARTRRRAARVVSTARASPGRYIS